MMDVKSLFRRKISSEATGEGPKLSRVLGLFQLTLLGIGAMVGTGIFVTAGTAAAGGANHVGAGPALMVSFFITAVACGFAALCYAEFAAMIPVAGSAYTYAYASFGEIIAWIIGWDLVLEYAVGNVAVAIGWSGYFTGLLRGMGIHLADWLTMNPMNATPEVFAAAPHLFGYPIVFNLPAIAVVLGVTALLCIGIRESVRANTLFVIINLSMILLFIVVGIFYVEPQNWTPFAPNGWNGIMSGAALIFFAFIGFDAISTASEETKNPAKNVPRAILISLAVCAVLYSTVAAILTGLVPYAQLGLPEAVEQPVAYAMRAIGQPWVAGILSAGAIVAMTSVLLVWQFGQTRILYVMSRDGLLPERLSKVDPKSHTPIAPTVIAGVLVALAAGFLDISVAVELTNIGTLFAFVLVSGGVLILRKIDPDRPRPFRVKWVPLVPLLAIGCCFYLMASLPLVTWERFGIWLAIGLVLYFVFSRGHSVRGNNPPA